MLYDQRSSAVLSDADAGPRWYSHDWRCKQHDQSFGVAVVCVGCGVCVYGQSTRML
ncbi:unnamed protein product [Ectocarpus sp. 6 AP-2014]